MISHTNIVAGCVAASAWLPILRRMAVIYIIQASNGLLKIGMTSNPRARVRGLQTGSPLDLRIVHRRSVATPRARTAEKRIHNKLRSTHVRGEWFSCNLERARQEVDRICLREDQGHAESFIFEKGDEVGHLEQMITITCKHCSHSRLLQLTIAQIARGHFRCGECSKRT